MRWKRHGMVVVSSQDNLQKEKTILEIIEQKRVDGIVFITHYDHSDMLANAAYHVAAERGRRVPEDLQIIGFDGVLDAWRGHPKLTTVEQDIPALAREAVSLLIKRIRREEVPSRVEVPARIVEGETTR